MDSLKPWVQWASGLMPSIGSDHVLARWVFLRLLGLVYLIAFASLLVQINGLIGSNGILPAHDYLAAVREQLGIDRFSSVPTIFWFGVSDAALVGACIAGALLSVLLIVNIAPMACCALLFVLYLSLFSVGQDFLSFQWDTLLLETGFLAIFFAPTNLWARLDIESAVSPVALFLLWFLLFRLMFESGMVKLTSGDSSWWNLTALRYHYETQPLPTWLGWYAHQLPLWVHQASTLLTYVIEIGLPLLLIFPWGRPIAAVGFILLMILISLTGNYNFFTLLTVALSALLIPDSWWAHVLPLVSSTSVAVPNLLVASTIVIALVTVPIGISHIIQSITGTRFLHGWAREISPFRITNSYGLFRVMTKTRPEVIIEGSDDGVTWQPYEFTYKVGDTHRAPTFVEPYQPRLDWQMWFAPYTPNESSGWLQNFMVRLLQGSPDVLSLMQANPFSAKPPQFIRAQLYEYHFTTPQQKAQTGDYWTREYIRDLVPTATLPTASKP